TSRAMEHRLLFYSVATGFLSVARCARSLVFAASRVHRIIHHREKCGGRLSSIWIRIIREMSSAASQKLQGQPSQKIHGVTEEVEPLSSSKLLKSRAPCYSTS